LAPFIAAMIVLTAVVLWRIQAQVSSADWVEHSDEVIARAKDAELQMRRIQLGVRAYVYSPDKRFLDEISDGRHASAKNLAQVAALVADNPQQEDRVLQISDLRETWIKTIENLIAQKDVGHFSPDIFAETRTRTQALFDALEDFVAVENRVRAGRDARQRSEDRLLFVLVPLLSAAVIFFLSYWGWHHIQQASEEFRRALVKAEQEKAKAEQASRAKDNFIGTISHELRNPLNSIMLWSSTLLSDRNQDPNTLRGLSAIERAVRAQAQLVDDLLDVARIESGRMRLDVQTMDLPEVVHAAVEGMRAAVEAKSIRMQEIIDPRIGPIIGDPGRLQQVVWNLLSNAVKFTPKDGRIEVRVERINSHVEITVADTGQGIDPASLESVFDRFWQAEAPSATRAGVGLGLTIVKEIVSLHGGTVSAHSDGLGKGSTFTVRLPLPVSTAPSLELRRHPTVAPIIGTTSAPRLDGASVLVVDDDPTACDALENLLVSLGAHVTAVASAQAALARLDTLRPDAVVADIGMPGHDGYFFATEVRKREAALTGNSRVPLVALTAYGRVEDKVKIFEAGFDNHVVKPADPAELSAILSTVIAARRVY